MKFFYVIILLAVASGCNNLVLDDDLSTTDPRTNFEYLWNEVNEKYAYFELKNVDWEAVYLKYDSLVTPNLSDTELFDILGSMLRELKDDHVNLQSSFNTSFFDIRSENPDNLDFRIISEHYLPRYYQVTGPFVHDYITTDSIGYVRFAAFSGILDYNHLWTIRERYENSRKIIFDIRENGGGTVKDLEMILREFFPERTHIYDTRIKIGPGRNDFSAPEKIYSSLVSRIIDPYRIVILTDRGTYSAGSFLALAAKAADHITLVGDTTGGGLGLPNGGQLPNGWTYRFSVSQTLSPEGQNYENGVPPDIFARLNREDTSRDEILDKAIEVIRGE